MYITYEKDGHYKKNDCYGKFKIVAITLESYNDRCKLNFIVLNYTYCRLNYTYCINCLKFLLKACEP